MLAGVTTILISTIYFYAWYRQNEAYRAWTECCDPVDSIPARFPKRKSNTSTLKLEELASKLGVELAPRNILHRSRPSMAQETLFAEIKGPLYDFVVTKLERPDDYVDAPPKELSAFIVLHSKEISDLRKHILSNETPEWDLDLEVEPDAIPIPNLIGHTRLQMILTLDILEKTRKGENKEALETLETSWRIIQGLRNRPELICQTIAAEISRYPIGVIRKMKDVPLDWQTRFSENDYEKSISTAMEADVWYFMHLANHSDTRKVFKAPTAYMPWIIVRPYMRLSAADYADKTRQALLDLGKQDLCALDEKTFLRTYRLAWWNRDLSNSHVWLAWERLSRLQLEMEFTRIILHLKSFVSTNGTWPTKLLSTNSSVCSSARWIYQISPDSLSVSLNNGFQPQVGKGTLLSLTYTIYYNNPIQR